jgi:hypothetical protein
MIEAAGFEKGSKVPVIGGATIAGEQRRGLAPWGAPRARGIT